MPRRKNNHFGTIGSLEVKTLADVVLRASRMSRQLFANEKKPLESNNNNQVDWYQQTIENFEKNKKYLPELVQLDASENFHTALNIVDKNPNMVLACNAIADCNNELVNDTRTNHKYSFGIVFLISIFAFISGFCTLTGIINYWQTYYAYLCALFPNLPPAPSHSVLYNILSLKYTDSDKIDGLIPFYQKFIELTNIDALHQLRTEEGFFDTDELDSEFLSNLRDTICLDGKNEDESMEEVIASGNHFLMPVKNNGNKSLIQAVDIIAKEIKENPENASKYNGFGRDFGFNQGHGRLEHNIFAIFPVSELSPEIQSEYPHAKSIVLRWKTTQKVIKTQPSAEDAKAFSQKKYTSRETLTFRVYAYSLECSKTNFIQAIKSINEYCMVEMNHYLIDNFLDEDKVVGRDIGYLSTILAIKQIATTLIAYTREHSVKNTSYKSRPATFESVRQILSASPLRIAGELNKFLIDFSSIKFEEDHVEALNEINKQEAKMLALEQAELF